MKFPAAKAAFLVGVLAVFSAAGSLQAADVNSRAGTSGFSFLKIDHGARAVSMGGAFTGLADDESSLYYNPAGIARYETKRFVGGYHNYFTDMQAGMAGIIVPLGYDKAVGFHINYLNYGDFIETDESGETLGEFSGGDLLFGLSGAMRYGYNWSFGATLKFIYEKIQDYSATGVAVDLGARYSWDRERYMVGFMAQHLGFQLSSLGEEKDKLPATFRGGGAIRPRGLPMLFAADVIVPIDNDPVVALGMEYYELEPLYFRIGWNSFGSNYRTADSDDSWSGLGLGVGFDVKNMQISYAFAPGAELGDSHRITISGGI